jgi:hypothetical protein
LMEYFDSQHVTVLQGARRVLRAPTAGPAA